MFRRLTKLASSNLVALSELPLQGLQSESQAAFLLQAHALLGRQTVHARWQPAASFASQALQGQGLKVYKPVTPGQRGRVGTSRTNLWKDGPFKALTIGLRGTGGRNAQGRITAYHRGGGHKRLYRLIDFRRTTAPEADGVVQRVEYDPNRTAHIALLNYKGQDGARDRYAYILAPQDLRPGDSVMAGASADIRVGNTLPLHAIPVGQQLHNIELVPGKGGQLVRSAGTSATLISKGTDGYAVVRLPSGEQRSVLDRCKATIGVLSNPQHQNIKLGKAGASRWRGIRPTVRGMAMNPCDHPHGGGRGKKKGRISQTPWGKPTKGYRTRNNPQTDRYIQLSRHKSRQGK
ncbi:hypothetical protein WJX72_000818 [[Myrmecia] bisecta]|uniref:Large ribosomal subunit protein uL2m n=1 Tax=[Myrmecia] bisecta TaxID=41462 RepID=A0AAW1PVY2_9CHLO